jgi:hypothetical protein
MKKLVHFILILAVLGGVGWAVWRGFQHRAAAEAEAAPEEAKEEHEPNTVMLEKEKWKALEFEMAEPAKVTLALHRSAFGRVLDPTPLVNLDSDLASAEAALAASRAENERSQKLLAAGENTSRKAAEAAEAQFRADDVKVAGLRRTAALQWGAAVAALDTAQRHTLAEALVRGESALVRVDVLPGDALAETPRAARLQVLGRETQPIDTKLVSPAADADPRTQAQGFIVRVDHPPFPLHPGMAVTAWLELAGEPRAGFAVPRSALLRHDGRSWVFMQEEEEKFVRKAVALEAPLDAEQGWFVAAGGELKEGDLLVVTGAEILLSEEMKSAGGEEE